MTTPTHSPEPSARYNDYRIVESTTGAVVRKKTLRSDDDDKSAHEWFRRVVASERTVPYELERHTFKSGEGYKWIPISPLPIFNGDLADPAAELAKRQESIDGLKTALGAYGKELARLREQNRRLRSAALAAEKWLTRIIEVEAEPPCELTCEIRNKLRAALAGKGGQL